MRPALKLNAIDQEHLQELYDQAGVSRDSLPYTDTFEHIHKEFQDRTFKNAERDQLFGAVLKYTRSSTVPSGEAATSSLSDEQLKILKQLAQRHGVGGKLLPYSDEFESARLEFNKHAGVALTEHEFWMSLMRAHGPKRRPPRPTKRAKVEVDDSDEDGE